MPVRVLLVKRTAPSYQGLVISGAHGYPALCIFGEDVTPKTTLAAPIVVTVPFLVESE